MSVGWQDDLESSASAQQHALPQYVPYAGWRDDPTKARHKLWMGAQDGSADALSHEASMALMRKCSFSANICMCLISSC